MPGQGHPRTLAGNGRLIAAPEPKAYESNHDQINLAEQSMQQAILTDIMTKKALMPGPVTLAGQHVTLVPLSADDHADDLYGPLNGAGAQDLWRYLFDGPYADRESFHASLVQKQNAPDMVFFAILDSASRKALGFCSLMRIDVPNRVIEIGNILYSPALQRTRGATETMFLLARHVFEDLGFRRYEWKCNSLNAPSRQAAKRLGFSFEGIFRQHMIVKGKNRDTAWFSMLDGEWPALKTAYQTWLSPANFDANGQQLQSLSALTHQAIAG